MPVVVPDEGKPFVVRMWHAVGVFRMLAVAVLVLGVVAGAQVSATTQSQQRIRNAAQSAGADQRVAEDYQRVSPVSRAAQREGLAQALASASASATPTKVAVQAAAPSPTKSSPTVKASPSPFGPIPASCSDYTGNVAIGCTLLLQSGYGLDQMPCLKNIWMKESGWRTTAGRTGGAYGIPQANPGTKMASYGADWQTNPATQIKWGLAYIKGKYGSPCGAWSSWQAHGYY